MELLDDEDQGQEEEKIELRQETVAAIEVARSIESDLERAGKRIRSKEEKWGPTLVERIRRKQNNRTSILQKAMELKKKKNLESVKGNSFSALQAENLAKIVEDINILVGCNNAESSLIVDNLIDIEKHNFYQFVGDHLEVMLPMNLDVSCSCPELVNN
jgi:hypothetical protein